MDIFIAILLLLIGLLLIVKGGDWFVESSVQIAKRSGIPELIIGATVVSIGTTIPEVLVSTIAVVQGKLSNDVNVIKDMSAIAINNSVGSMLCNMGLILGIVLIFSTITTKGRSFVEKGVFLVFTTVVLTIFAITDKSIVLWEGIVLLIMFLSFIALNLLDAKRQLKLEPSAVQTKEDKKTLKPVWWVILFFILGAGGIAGGAYLLVNCGQYLAVKMNIPSAIIGATIIAVGTSLPELVTAVTSLKKKSVDLSMGNIIGANIINATLLLGLISTITGQGLALDNATYNLSIWFMLAITAITIIPCFFLKKTRKWQGIGMLILYLAYIVTNITLVVMKNPIVL